MDLNNNLKPGRSKLRTAISFVGNKIRAWWVLTVRHRGIYVVGGG